MPYPRILTIQDISCVGQCSLTVALPVLSACGLETCVLPSAVLSTHTGGFDGYVRPDHGRNIWGEDGKPGYGLYDRALGACYLSGLFEAVEGRRKEQ